jgi:hypothetical protein
MKRVFALGSGEPVLAVCFRPTLHEPQYGIVCFGGDCRKHTLRIRRGAHSVMSVDRTCLPHQYGRHLLAILALTINCQAVRDLHPSCTTERIWCRSCGSFLPSKLYVNHVLTKPSEACLCSKSFLSASAKHTATTCAAGPHPAVLAFHVTPYGFSPIGSNTVNLELLLHQLT